MAAGAAQHFDMQAAFGIVAERQVEVGDAQGGAEIEVHCQCGEMIVTCCVSLLVMLSMPQIGGGTNWPEAPTTVTMVGLPFEVARSGVMSIVPNHIDVPG